MDYWYGGSDEIILLLSDEATTRKGVLGAMVYGV